MLVDAQHHNRGLGNACSLSAGKEHGLRSAFRSSTVVRPSIGRPPEARARTTRRPGTCGLQPRARYTLVHVNTLLLQDILAEEKWQKRLTDADRRALSPLFWTHVNPTAGSSWT